jgi:hypothetical protein
LISTKNLSLGLKTTPQNHFTKVEKPAALPAARSGSKKEASLTPQVALINVINAKTAENG